MMRIEKPCEMAEIDVAEQLKSFVSSLRNQGILDESYDALVNLKNEYDPLFLLETITLFFQESDLTMHEIQRAMLNYPMEYSNLVSKAHKLKGCSSSIGGTKMAAACRELRQASENENMGRSVDAFTKMKCEYEVLRRSLAFICQMEESLVAAKDEGPAST